MYACLCTRSPTIQPPPAVVLRHPDIMVVRRPDHQRRHVVQHKLRHNHISILQEVRPVPAEPVIANGRVVDERRLPRMRRLVLSNEGVPLNHTVPHLLRVHRQVLPLRLVRHRSVRSIPLSIHRTHTWIPRSVIPLVDRLDRAMGRFDRPFNQPRSTTHLLSAHNMSPARRARWAPARSRVRASGGVGPGHAGCR